MPVDTPAQPHGDDDDDETQARNVASRAKLLPEEQAVGSDDPQAQAQAIMEEAKERIEHPERDISLPASPLPSEEDED